MEDFALKVLQYGVLGLCAVMLVAAWHIIRTEQQRGGQPRAGIIRFTLLFMGFCVFLTLLNSYVQLRERSNVRNAEGKLERIRAAAAPLLNARKSLIDGLPNNLREKQVLQTFTSELQKILVEDENP